MDDVETATKAAAQAAIDLALETSEQDTTTEVNTTTTQPRMIGTWETNKESSKDATTKEFKQLVEEGAREDTEDWPKALRNHHVKDANYIVVEDTVLTNSKAIISTNLRSRILAALHRSHGGVNGIRARAGEVLFWPGMNADIQRIRDECKTCRQTAPSQAATPPKPLPVPDYPFQMMSSDYFEMKGHHYLVMAKRNKAAPTGRRPSRQEATSGPKLRKAARNLR